MGSLSTGTMKYEKKNFGKKNLKKFIKSSRYNPLLFSMNCLFLFGLIESYSSLV